MFEKQKQEAGDNSQQIQAGTVIFNNGIDEKRAREIVDEKLHEVINGYSQEAQEIAENRIGCFANDLVPKLVKANLLESLKDPSIQVLLIDAQKAAASTERLADYSLLSELLIHRVEKGSNRNVRAGVNHAIKIVDEITDEALLGLTAAHTVSRIVPVTGNIQDGLNVMNDLFGKIIYDTLPSGSEWIEHLDILDAVRINSIGTLKKLEQYYSEKLPGYIDVGIDKVTENFQKANDIVREAELPDDILCEHELRPGYIRLQIRNINDLESLSITRGISVNVAGKTVVLPMSIKFSEAQKNAIKSIYALYNNDDNLKAQNIAEFMKMWDGFENLKNIRTWWDLISLSFQTTPVGRVLAQANAQRCDPNFPALD